MNPRRETSIGSPNGAARTIRTVVPRMRPRSINRLDATDSPPTDSTVALSPGCSWISVLGTIQLSRGSTVISLATAGPSASREPATSRTRLP